MFLIRKQNAKNLREVVNGCLHHFRQAIGKDCRICGRKDSKNNGRPRRSAGLISSRAKVTPRFAKRLPNHAATGWAKAADVWSISDKATSTGCLI